MECQRSEWSIERSSTPVYGQVARQQAQHYTAFAACGALLACPLHHPHSCGMMVILCRYATAHHLRAMLRRRYVGEWGCLKRAKCAVSSLARLMLSLCECQRLPFPSVRPPCVILRQRIPHLSRRPRCCRRCTRRRKVPPAGGSLVITTAALRTFWDWVRRSPPGGHQCAASARERIHRSPERPCRRPLPIPSEAGIASFAAGGH